MIRSLLAALALALVAPSFAQAQLLHRHHTCQGAVPVTTARVAYAATPVYAHAVVGQAFVSAPAVAFAPSYTIAAHQMVSPAAVPSFAVAPSYSLASYQLVAAAPALAVGPNLAAPAAAGPLDSSAAIQQLIVTVQALTRAVDGHVAQLQDHEKRLKALEAWRASQPGGK